MKNMCKVLLAVFIMLMANVTLRAQEVTFVMGEQGWSNSQTIGSGSFDANFSYNSGTGDDAASEGPKYYDSGSNVRFYAKKNGTGYGNWMEIIPASGITITGIELTSTNNYVPAVKYNIDNGADVDMPVSGIVYSATGINATTSFKFRNAITGNSNTQIRLTQIKVTYTAGGQQQETVATPTFTPNGGTFNEESITVNVSCATEGAVIRYTNDGSEPTEDSQIFPATGITLTETTTLKAKAWKDGMTASAVASATYTLQTITLITIAEARDLANNEYAYVEGIVTFIDGRNIYVQDATAGIVLYLNSNTIPSALALGDKVRGYGKKTTYNGLVELTGIKGNDAAQFSIVNSGNTLPLAVKTVAEVLEGGAGLLQSTRVMIEDAVIGAINTSNNTPLTQDDAVINIYKVPALPEISEGDHVNVIGVVGYYNAAQLRVASAADVQAMTTTLTVSPIALEGFTYEQGEGPSAAQTLTINGSNLGANVLVEMPDNFEASMTADGNYSNNVTIATVNGALTDATVYVRLVNGLVMNTYSGTATVTAGSNSIDIQLSGNVTISNAVAQPTLTPAAGTYLIPQQVTISSTTEGATIHYTIDGSEPTEDSPVYTSPIAVNATMTIKAMATKTNWLNSAVTTASYEIRSLMTIAEARQLSNNQYAAVEGIVTFIDGRNIYVQDATAGVVLYLNNNTVPSALAIGDIVRGYGKKTVYSGLVELTSINGSSSEQFAIMSHNNTLPLAEKTIAEILADYSGDNMLQSTRVKVSQAIIGTINNSNNTPITQDGSTMNLYKMPVVEGLIAGDYVTVTGILGCYNAVQMRVVSASDVQYTHRPTITVNPSSLGGFNYIVENGPSEVKNFSISFSNLQNPSVIVTPSENYEVSFSGPANFFPESPATINGAYNFNNFNCYVRLKAGLPVGTYNEQITLTSENAETVYLNVAGQVIEQGGGQGGDDNYKRIASLSDLANGDKVIVAARYDENATNYVALQTTLSSGKLQSTEFTSEFSGADEVIPAAIADNEADYYWTVTIDGDNYTFINANGEVIGYNSGTNFNMGGDKTQWLVATGGSDPGALVGNYDGFTIVNVSNGTRAWAINSNYHSCGAYSTSNMTGSNASGYNFYLDLFVKGEGGVPPTPTVATPTFTPAAGTYFEAQTVSITCATEGATIHYTIDGSEPTTNSTIYTTPLAIGETTTVKAIAVKEGYNESGIATAEYIIQLGMATIFSQNWEGDMNGWSFVDVNGNASWSIASYSNNHYAYINGYNQGANEDWCISPAFNLDNYGEPTLSFKTAKNYNGADLQVFFSNDYDGVNPTTATWTPLTCALSSTGWTWVESGSIDLSSFSGTNCYIGFKYTCTESEAAGWELDDCLLVGSTSEPTLTVVPQTLNGFSYIVGAGPSAEQSFNVSAINLNASIVVIAATDYEISLTSGDAFSAQSTISLAPVAGSIAETPVYVRLKAGLAIGNYDAENIIVGSPESGLINVVCSGTVNEEPAPGDDWRRISSLSEIMDGSQVIIAARYNETANSYYVMTAATSGKPDGVLTTTTMSGSDEILPDAIVGEAGTYSWTVSSIGSGFSFTNAAGQMLGYTSSTNFATGGDNIVWNISQASSIDTGVMVPNYTGFNIINGNVETRAIALNNNYKFGPYSTSNMTNGNGANYNFYLDIFISGQAGTPTVAAPVFAPNSGTYYEAQDVVITCATDGATIYYSTDSENGPWSTYADAIHVDEDMTIWAYAEKADYENSPVVSAEYIIIDDIVMIFNQDWEGDWNGWTEVAVEGEVHWTINSYSGNHYAYANGYNQPASESWLISPAFDLDSYDGVMLGFLSARNYTGPDIEVYFSNDYDGQNPAAASWQPIDCSLSTGNWEWVASGDINMDVFSGSNCYIGFRYTSTDSEAAGWEIDDIILCSVGSSTDPTLNASANTLSMNYIVGNGPSEAVSYTLTAANLEGEGEVTLLVDESFEISLDGIEFSDMIDIAYANGTLVDQPVTVYVRMVEGLEVGTYEGIILHDGGGAELEISLTGEVMSDDFPFIDAYMPYYIQGNNGSNNNRVPVAILVYFENLEPNTTYRYVNQFVDGNDGPDASGAGNVIYASLDGFYRTTSPSLSTEGGYGEFTTDMDGEGIVWCVNEPTANTRFTPGNEVYLRIRINDGHDGTTADQIFTSEDAATVLNFGTEHDNYQGSAFYVKSEEEPMTFAMMFSNDYDFRPTYSTPIETTGVEYASISQYANFYKEEVAGKNGYFGGIIPNDNEEGINIIWIIDMESYVINDYYTVDGDGMWGDVNTANPSCGLDNPIFIALIALNVEEGEAADVKVWNFGHEIMVENAESESFEMTVFNVMGQPVMSKNIDAMSSIRFSHNLADGIYVITLQNSKSTMSAKVIVK